MVGGKPCGTVFCTAVSWRVLLCLVGDGLLLQVFIWLSFVLRFTVLECVHALVHGPLVVCGHCRTGMFTREELYSRGVVLGRQVCVVVFLGPLVLCSFFSACFRDLASEVVIGLFGLYVCTCVQIVCTGVQFVCVQFVCVFAILIEIENSPSGEIFRGGRVG
jgi:hypothetical protein